MKQSAERPHTPGATGLAAELEFRSHFANKRHGTRRVVELELVVRGRAGRFQGRSVDISRSGVLLWISERARARHAGDMAAFAARIAQHFKTGADIRFLAHGFAVRAEVVRVTNGWDREGRPFLFACRFRRPLTEFQCSSLGVDLTDERDFDL